MGEVLRLRRREEVQLPPRPQPPRELTARLLRWPLLALFIPAAGLALATALQRWLEGPAPLGDQLLRWLSFASVLSLACGLLAGLLFARGRLARLSWAVWGAASPWAVALATVALVQAARPLRDRWAAHSEAACLENGRLVCSRAEFERRCAEAGRATSRARETARALLGAPEQALCTEAGCTDRFRYQGPWKPDNFVVSGAQLCSVVSDAAGKGLRSALTAATTTAP